MKYSLLFCLLAASFLYVDLLSAQSQSSLDLKIDSRLYQVYDKAYLEQLKKENPILLMRWSYYLDHAFYITEKPVGQQEEKYPVIVVKDLENINILLLEREQNLKRDWNHPSVYQISSTKKFLVYLSGKEYTAKMKANLSK